MIRVRKHSRQYASRWSTAPRMPSAVEKRVLADLLMLTPKQKRRALLLIRKAYPESTGPKTKFEPTIHAFGSMEQVAILQYARGKIPMEAAQDAIR